MRTYENGRSVCILVFAVAADGAALRRAIVAGAGRATFMGCADKLQKEEVGASEQTRVTAGADEGVLSDDAWVFASVSGGRSFVALPDSPISLSPARYQAAASEMRQWQRLLSLMRVPHLHIGLPCTSRLSTRDTQANNVNARAHTSAAATETVDESLSSGHRADTVASAEGAEHASLLWARIPRTTACADAAEFDVSGSRVSGTCGVAATDVSSSSGHHLVCIDVGGIYVASSRRHPRERHTPNASLQPAEAAATNKVRKSERASRRPNAARVRRACARTEEVPSLHAPHSNAKTREEEERGAEASQSLWGLLHQRFVTARRTCPFVTDAGSTAPPLTLTEVWVIPLLSAEGEGSEPLCSATMGISVFPLLVQDTHKSGSADCAAADSDGVRAVRLARHPPTHVLYLGRDDDNHSSDTSFPIICEETTLRPRKRPRDNAVGRQGETEKSPWISAQAPLALSDAVLLHSRGCSGGGAECLSLKVPAVRLRVLERDFLLRSCYFSEWCCVVDFDRTSRFFSPHRDTWAGSATAYHAFYSALRRCVLAEDRRVQHLIEEEAGEWVKSCGSLTDADVTSTCGAAPLPRSPTEALFKENAFEGKGTGDSGDLGGEQVWSMEELWGLWVRLGWTPPLTWPRVRVRLRLTECVRREGVDERSIWDFSPRALLALLSRVATAVNTAYIEARKLQPTEDRQGHRVNAEVDGDADTTVADLDGVSDMCRANSCPESIPSSLAARFESSVQAQRLLEFQAVLSVTPELVTGPLLAEMSGAAVAAPCVPTTPSFAITASVDARAGLPALSAAARDLAGDISATTVLSSAHPVPSPAGNISDVVMLTLTWLRGVLESPALLIPSLGVSGATEKEGINDCWGGAGAYYSGRSSVEEEAASLTALLARQSPFQPEQLRWSAPNASSASHLPQSRLLPSLPDTEMYCEVADVAELRWGFAQATTATTTSTDYHEALSIAASQNHTLGSLSSVPSTASCCALACAEVARLAHTETAEESVNAFRTSHQTLSATNPLAAFLYTRFVGYLQEQGVVTAALPSGERSREGDAKFPGRDDEHTLCDACPAGRSSVAMLPSHHSSMQQPGGSARCGAAAVSLPEDVNCLDDKTGPSMESDSVKTLLTETVVHVVQQNKPVVRRILALIQSYSGVVAEATAEDNGNARCTSSTDGTATTKKNGIQPTEAVVQDVWNCLAPERNDAACTDEVVTQLPFCAASCAKATARRLVQAFWENVAATARLHLSDRLDKISGSEEGANGDSEEEEEPAGGSAVSPARLDGAAYSPAEAVSPKSSVRQRSYSARENGAETKAEKSSTCLSSSYEQTHASPGFPLLSSASMSRPIPSPTPSRQSCETLSRAVRALGGGQAMSLYMQHVLQCTNTAGHQQGQAQVASCPLLTGATKLPGRAPRCATGTPASSTNPQQPSYWLHHALFLLSYGLACPPDMPVVSGVTSSTPTHISAKGYNPVDQYQEADQLTVPPPPALAAFRVLRYGKLLLDVWIREALEVYVQVWKLSVQAE
ncbi:hypothetical protein, conserved [Leishmania tarentolae]|uniref:Uncharacterized protein n=1 Tax=Leishmania tarentolae TaxID=5689 RepID=A0A640KUQ0_LEITA|nr:hypothetical protein, conserved [Leishmania tarentolae]